MTKSRVDGIDKSTTKSRQDRVLELCPRAVDVMKRRLELRHPLELAGRIEHQQLVRARHGSVSWNLMLGKKPVRVRQHGHIWHQKRGACT